MKDNHLLVLVVLDGDQAGASARIKRDESVIVGSESDGDIVLRGDQFIGNRFRLTACDKYARVEVISGVVEIQGQQIIQGTLINLLPYIPMKVGGITLAYGANNSPRWNKLLNTEKESLKNHLTDVHHHMNSPRHESKKRNLGSTTIWLALIFVSALTIFNNLPEETIDIVTKSPIEIGEILTRAGFPSLEVDETNEGIFVIQGNLDTTQQQTFLKETLSELDVFYDLRVLVGEQLVSTVKEFYRVNGIPAKVESQGDGAVEIKTREADLSKLSRVGSLAKKDVVGLKNIVVENTRPPEPVDEEFKTRDPGKRIASIVPGDPAYIITLDGARYFVGAMMPTGHKISAIFDQKVVLDKGGKMSTLEF